MVPRAPGAQERASNWQLIRWMVRQGLEYPGKCLLLLGFNLVLLALSLSGLSLVGLEIDVIRHVMESGPAPRPPWGGTLPAGAETRPYLTVCLVAAGIVLLAGIRMGLRYVTVMAQSRLINTILAKLRSDIYDKLQRLSFRFFDANETGSIIMRATTDTSAISNFADMALIQIIVLAVTLVVYFFYMLHLHVTLTLVGLATTPLLAAGSIYYSWLVRPALQERSRLNDRLIATLSENIQGQHVVKGFSLEQAEIEKFKRANLDLRMQQRWLFARSSAYSAIVGFLTQVNLILVLLYGGLLILRDRDAAHPALTVGTLIVFTALLQQFSSQVMAVAGIANTLQASLTAAGRVYEVLDAPLEIADAPKALPLARARGEVCFERVAFGYKPQEAVLREVSFSAKAGQCIAILGATGSGKSTLLSLISRFYDPTHGRVLIDGIDARQIKLDDLRRNIGLVFQESFLFSNTVAANIAFGWPDAPRERVEKAARIAAAHEFIMALPKGYDTVIGEQGMTLSGGQRQRLAIARAVLLEPAILILDDATAAIDPETEHEILLAMDNAMRGRTTFVVAHRLSTLRRADLVLVLDRGRIAQAGTHQELMNSGGLYSQVARMQVGDPESKQIILARQWYEGQIDSPLGIDEGKA